MFLPCMTLFFHFKCTLICRLQFVSIRTSLKFCRLVMIYIPQGVLTLGLFILFFVIYIFITIEKQVLTTYSISLSILLPGKYTSIRAECCRKMNSPNVNTPCGNRTQDLMIHHALPLVRT